MDQDVGSQQPVTAVPGPLKQANFGQGSPALLFANMFILILKVFGLFCLKDYIQIVFPSGSQGSASI